MKRFLPLLAVPAAALLILHAGCGKKDGLVPPDFSIKPTPTVTPGGPCGYPTGWFFAAGAEGWNVAWTEDKTAPTPTPVCGVAYPGVCFPVTVTWDGSVGFPAPGSLAVSVAFSRQGEQAHFSRSLPSPVNMASSSI